MLRTHWRVIVGWALFHLLALVAMIVVTVIVGVGIGLAAGVDQGSGAAGAIGGLAGVLVTALIETALIVGLYRLMLRPEDPGFLHLRLGADEARMVGVWLATSFGALLWVGVSTTFVAWVQRATTTPVAWLAAIVCVVGLIYLWTRFCLTAPMTFDTHHFQFAGSWRMTQGRVAPLMGMTLIAFCLLAMMAILGWLFTVMTFVWTAFLLVVGPIVVLGLLRSLF